MDNMENEEDYDPKNLKNKSLEEIKKLYDDYYECDAFEIQTLNSEIIMLTDLIIESIISKNEEFPDLLNCKTEIDYMCADIDIDELLDLLFEDDNYFDHLIKVIRVNLWALKRIGENPFANQHIKIKSFSIKENKISIKFNTIEDKEIKRIKIDLYDIAWGIIIFKDKPLYQIIYEEMFSAPFI